uniref:Tegument protein UL16 n=1 Tax=Mastomys natalensis cytomegalovirus 1 TaxID=2973541 RepID=A0A9Y1ILH6_9BETA|nr:tegument protein UL16 [Mastomys natalensis cytomegalovirus 1]WEG71180.1 tegument protein UL16 [Mastomys natalensis cytomegalovirus 1]
MPTSRLSVRSLKNIRKFIERECTWFLVRKGLRHREYRAVCSQSPLLGKVSDTDDGRCLSASIMMLKRTDGYVLCVTVNKQSVGQFSCAGIRREKITVEGLGEPVYTIQLLATLTPIKLGFTPYFLPVRSVGGGGGLSPGVIYQNACIVNPEEAAKIQMNGDGIVFGLGGTGAWVRVKNGVMTIYTYALCFDVFAACCDRLSFPSLAKIYFESTKCGNDTCSCCKDSGRHVDPTGKFCGCTPDPGVCFCYTSCGGLDAPITNRTFMPYLELEDSFERVFCKKFDGKRGLPIPVDACIGGTTETGAEVPIRNEPWQLLQIEPGLTRLIILACPVLKRTVIEHV